MKRATIIVLDSLGVGELPDAEEYGDKGANTLKHIAEQREVFRIPNLISLGMGNIPDVTVIKKERMPIGAFGRLAERSTGKDTITGHWEIGGILTKVPFKTFPKFPKEFMEAYEREIGIETLGNYAASGTEIIKQLGEEHKKTGKPIVYTSADSVFQIAVNVGLTPLGELYRYCEAARKMLVGELQVARVIARPFIEENGMYTRTADRRDYAVSPTDRTALDHVKEAGKEVFAIGKISDIFAGRGVTKSLHNLNNMDGVDHTVAALKEEFEGLIFTNLVDFDSLYGHRRDPQGYGKAIEEFDARLPELMSAMKDEDILMICADHGNDPIHSGWDHTREYVPLLVYGKQVIPGTELGTGSSFADIGATVCEYLGAKTTTIGNSFLHKILG